MQAEEPLCRKNEMTWAIITIFRRVMVPTNPKSASSRFREHRTKCVVCEGVEEVRDIDLPYIFLHLVAQLASVNIKIKVDTKYK